MMETMLMPSQRLDVLSQNSLLDTLRYPLSSSWGQDAASSFDRSASRDSNDNLPKRDTQYKTHVVNSTYDSAQPAYLSPAITDWSDDQDPFSHHWGQAYSNDDSPQLLSSPSIDSRFLECYFDNTSQQTLGHASAHTSLDYTSRLNDVNHVWNRRYGQTFPLEQVRQDFLNSRHFYEGMQTDLTTDSRLRSGSSAMRSERSDESSLLDGKVCERRPENDSEPYVTSPKTHRRHPSDTKSCWSPEEDALLLRTVAEVKEIYDAPLPWSRVSASIPRRSAAKCSKRYHSLCDTEHGSRKSKVLTKGAWTKEEDDDLLFNFEKYASRTEPGMIPWTKIGLCLRKPRTGLQACARYTEALDKSVIRGRWTKQEDQALLDHWKQVGGRWSLISTHIPGRTQRQCASRFTVLCKRLTAEDLLECAENQAAKA